MAEEQAGQQQAVPAEAFNALSTMHQLSLEAFLSRSGHELIFRICNRTIALAPYDRAILWGFDGSRAEALGVSGKASFDVNAPLLEAYAELAGALREQGEPVILGEEHFPLQEAGWQAIQAQQAGVQVLWQPIVIEGRVAAGVWLERTPHLPPWEEKDLRLLGSLMVSYGAAWEKLLMRTTIRRRLRQSITRSRVLPVAVLIAVLLIVIPVHLRITAPCEVIPESPKIIAAPLEGVIKEIMVDPGEEVEEGQLLYRYDSEIASQELDVVEKQVAITRASMKRAEVESFSRPEARAQLLTLRNQLEQEELRLKLARTRYGRLDVRATHAGVVMLDNKQAWQGRPVKVGERVLSIIEPGKTRLAIFLPEDDNIKFLDDMPVRIFLSIAPNDTRLAQLDYVAQHVTMTPDGMPAFRAEAIWDASEDRSTLRLGLSGRAMLYGKKVSIAWWLLRKPWASVRRYFGF